MKESKVEAHLVERVTATGGLIRKVAWIGRRGCPDRLVGWPERTTSIGCRERVYPARHAMVETKRPLGKARADQAREHERLRRLGIWVEVLDTIEAVDKFIEDMLK